MGDLARPDLAIEPEQGARDLFRSLRRLLQLPDAVEVWPGHVGGSLCGGSQISDKPVSTVGYERRHNPLLALEDEQELVRALTTSVQPQPPNFEEVVELNRGSLLEPLAPVELLAPARVRELAESGVLLLDGRDPREWDAMHVVGSINVTLLKPGVGTRVSWIAALESPVVVVTAGEEQAQQMARLLEAVGLRNICGYLAASSEGWREGRLALESTEAIDVSTLAERLHGREVELLDVREEDEWEAGHVAGSLHVAFHDLRDGAPKELERLRGKPLAVACSAGNRSAMGVSLLRRAGFDRLQHVAEGGVADLDGYGVELVGAARS